jgi:hypothetical protein
MTADIVIPALLTDILPRWACLSELRLGDLVKFRIVPQPVTITDSERDDTRQVFTWVCVGADGKVSEGRGVHDVEQVLLIARAETVPAVDVRVGNVLLMPKRKSPYQVVTEDPYLQRGLLNIPWNAGYVSTGPQVIGGLQLDPDETVRRAARGVAL